MGWGVLVCAGGRLCAPRGHPCNPLFPLTQAHPHLKTAAAEVHAEKPNPVIFEAACAALGLPPEHCVHVGDDRRNDLYGARDSGCFAWLWGQDVYNFEQVERRLATGNYIDSLSGV